MVHAEIIVKNTNNNARKNMKTGYSQQKYRKAKKKKTLYLIFHHSRWATEQQQPNILGVMAKC
jgi:hypothetical protein